MTKIMNRAERKHKRRVGALERIDNGHRRADTIDRREATATELVALYARISIAPSVTFTRKRKADGWTAARAAHFSGRLER